ncbi:MAG: hypothetical protein KDA84_07270, partial [Planctomycetaceae bacterium]|nr:hypothetical protein [Planctomycetaceae bacterium]
MQPSFLQKLLALVPLALSWLGLSFIIGLALLLLTKIRPTLKRFHLQDIEPSSHRELLALYNPYNYRHVQVAGYNNGVVHFGWRFPQKTVVLTRAAGKTARLSGNAIKVDAGITLKRAVQVANAGGKEFLVLPNYSYVSIGTAFFVPIHGSGSEVSTLGESIQKVVLYDPIADKIRLLKRNDTEFSDWMYNREKP